jgi:glucoamylase
MPIYKLKLMHLELDNPSTTLITSTISKSPSTSTSKMTSACATATTVAVTFNELKTTTFGQTVKIVGNTAELGNWNTANAVALSAASYTSSNPLWSTNINLAAGAVIQYKYIVVDNGGAVTWEHDPNHTYTVPRTCATTAAVSDNWQT